MLTFLTYALAVGVGFFLGCCLSLYLVWTPLDGISKVLNHIPKG